MRRLMRRRLKRILRELLDQGADLLLTGGGVTIDPLDPIELALKPLGAEMVHMGAPTRGSMFWLARVGDMPAVNVASCRMWAGGAVGDFDSGARHGR